MKYVYRCDNMDRLKRSFSFKKCKTVYLEHIQEFLKKSTQVVEGRRTKKIERIYAL